MGSSASGRASGRVLERKEEGVKREVKREVKRGGFCFVYLNNPAKDATDIHVPAKFNSKVTTRLVYEVSQQAAKVNITLECSSTFLRSACRVRFQNILRRATASMLSGWYDTDVGTKRKAKRSDMKAL